MERINIAELLKDCPSGMELDCTMFNDVVFHTVEFGKTIIVTRTNGTHIHLDKYGVFFNEKDAKCVIFPKGKTTWEGFVPPLPPCQFKDGDVIVDKYGAVAIYKRVHSSFEEPYVDFHCGITSKTRSFFIKDSDSLQHCGEIDTIRFASEEEKAQLFQAIKDNGYKWNEETKTLEKLQFFKVGDKIIPKDSINKSRVINAILDNEYNLFGGGKIPFSDQDNWELAPNKFDITTLKPYDKVLARDTHRQIWIADLFSHKVKEQLGGYKFACIGHYWHQCIPYEGNEHLLNTTDDCDEHFKTWK